MSEQSAQPPVASDARRAALSAAAGRRPGLGHADALVLVLLLVSAAFVLASLRRQGLMLLDEGYVIHAAQRMVEGELLYRDVFAHYGPVRYHLLAAAFDRFGVSVVVARTVFLGVLLVNVALVYLVARRFAPPVLAALPAALVFLVPGPWTKAFFGFTVALGTLALARALERPTRARLAVLGLAAGLGVATRQDVGIALSGAALAASALPGLLPARFGRSGAASIGRAAADAGWVAAWLALVLGAIAAWYFAQGGLGSLVEMSLVRAFTQRSAYGFGLPRLIASGGIGAEGRLAGTILLAPLAILALAVPAWGMALRRRGLDAHTALVGALLAVGVAALTNAFYQLYVLRFLQSAVPYTLLATWMVAAAADALARRWPGAGGAGARALVVGMAFAAAAGLVYSVIWGIGRVLPGDEYTGSLRALRLRTAVPVLGDVLFVEWERAEEIRLLRAFVERHVPRGQPIAVLPLNAMYYPLLERPNPMWLVIGDFVAGDFLISDAEKREQVSRLLASPARYALVDAQWLLQPGPIDALRRVLLEEFHPVRSYRTTLVLERGADPDLAPLLDVLRRAAGGTTAAGDAATLRAIIAARPAEPFAHMMLALVCDQLGCIEEGADALAAAARLDPVDPRPLEWRAELMLGLGRVEEAEADLRSARLVRESPETRALAARLDGWRRGRPPLR